MRNRTVMEQVTRYNNVTQEDNIEHSGQNQQTSRNCTGQICMRNRMAIEQVTRYNNSTQEDTIKVRIKAVSETTNR
jgi:hypothetical protein